MSANDLLTSPTLTPVTLSRTFIRGSNRHVALTISGSTHTLYLDGTQVGINLSGGNMLTYGSAIPKIYIGCAGDLSYGFTGIIDDFKIWNRALLSSEINYIISQNPIPLVYIPFTNAIVDGSYASINSSSNLGTKTTAFITDISLAYYANFAINGPDNVTKIYPTYSVTRTNLKNSISNFGNLINCTVSWWQYKKIGNNDSFAGIISNLNRDILNLNVNVGNGMLYQFQDGGTVGTEVTENLNIWYFYVYILTNIGANNTGTIKIYRNNSILYQFNTYAYESSASAGGAFTFDRIGYFNNANYKDNNVIPINKWYAYKFSIYDTALSTSQITDLYNQK